MVPQIPPEACRALHEGRYMCVSHGLLTSAAARPTRLANASVQVVTNSGYVNDVQYNFVAYVTEFVNAWFPQFASQVTGRCAERLQCLSHLSATWLARWSAPMRDVKWKPMPPRPRPNWLECSAVPGLSMLCKCSRQIRFLESGSDVAVPAGFNRDFASIRATRVC